MTIEVRGCLGTLRDKICDVVAHMHEAAMPYGSMLWDTGRIKTFIGRDGQNGSVMHRGRTDSSRHFTRGVAMGLDTRDMVGGHSQLLLQLSCNTAIHIPTFDSCMSAIVRGTVKLTARITRRLR